MTIALPMMMRGMASASTRSYTDDVFDIRLYNGTGGAQSLVNGFNMSTTPGMVWIKRRNSTENHCVFDTIRGVNNVLVTNSTAASAALANSVTAFNSNGFSVTSATGVNSNGGPYVAWTFMQGAKFFQMATISHTTGTASTVDLSSLGTVGMVTVKCTSAIGNWVTWHKNAGAGTNLKLNLTDAESATGATLSVSGTTLTMASTAATGTYIVYAWAHDSDPSTGMIQCGGYSGSASTLNINVGWEPQMIFIKRRNAVGSWVMFDNLRGMPFGLNDAPLLSEATTAETLSTLYVDPTPTGFSVNSNATVSGAGNSFIWMAVRMSHKPPTTGTQVFNSVVYTGTAGTNRLLNMGIQPDVVWLRQRSGSGNGYEGFLVGNRLRGQGWVKTYLTGPVEQFTATGLDQQLASAELGTAFSSNVGIYVGNSSGTTNTSANINSNTTANNHVAIGFRRRAKVFDSVCYVGDATAGKVINHNLGAVPEMIIIKSLTTTNNWLVWHKDLSGLGYQMNLDLSGGQQGPYSDLNNTAPTSTQFDVGSTTIANGNGNTHHAMLFATLAGVSKVGTYTGNGSSLAVDCGFSSAARFLLIKAVTAAGEWYVFDSARGIVSGIDPTLTTSSTAAELNTTDSVEGASNGFIVGQSPSTNLNASGVKYIFLAFS